MKGNNYYTVKYNIIDFSYRLLIVTHTLPGNPEYPRDTFAGKILITFQNQIPVSKFLSNFYRQKCRAAAEILYYIVNYTIFDFSS